MEEQLSKTPFFAGDAISVADIALYAYTHDGRCGRLRPRRLSGGRAWLTRVEADPGHVPITWLPELSVGRVRRGSCIRQFSLQARHNSARKPKGGE